MTRFEREQAGAAGQSVGTRPTISGTGGAGVASEARAGAGGRGAAADGRASSETREAAGDRSVTRAVRERYQRIATEGSACCGPTCCGDPQTADASQRVEAGAALHPVATATAATEPGGTAGDRTTASAERISRSIGYSAAELGAIPAEANLGLGCGNPTAIAALQPGQRVLDLGSGAGIDCFLAAGRVGPTGTVIGVDMTPAMIERARDNAERGGFENVEFRLGELEALPVADSSVDVVISNCVLNLVPDRARALREAFRVLAPGGKLVISDMVSDLETPEALANDPDAVAGCLPVPGERYLEDLRAAGFREARLTDERPYPVAYVLDDPGVRALLDERPEVRSEMEGFAAAIRGAHIEAVRP